MRHHARPQAENDGAVSLRLGMVVRFCCAVWVLALLLSPILAHGDDDARSVLVNGQCSVPADPQWTPQESFVWHQVCVGEVADFNKGSHYGGNLDPKRPEGLPDSRILRLAFLETILLDNKYRTVLTRRGVIIARLTDILDLQNVQLGGEFALQHSLLEKGVNFSGLRSMNAVSLWGSNITGGLLMNGGQIGGQLALGRSKITGPLHLEELQIGGSLFMDDNAQFCAVSLIDVHVGGQLNLTGAKVMGKMLVQGIQVYSTVHLSRGAKFAQGVDFIFDRVGQNVELAGGSFHQDVDFTGTQIDGELRLGRPDYGPASWSPNLMLTLRNTSVGAIQDLRNSWPDKLDLTGFTYRNLGGIYGRGDPMIGRPAKWFQNWLGRQASYVQAPYHQLASVLREQGRPDTAAEVLYAGKKRERAQSSFPSFVLLTASELFIGYGYHPFWSLYWAFTFLIVGTLFLWFSGEGWRIRWHYNLIDALFYSFDLLLPIIRLREKHYQIDLESRVRYYFYLHKIMGYVLASFLIAGIAGLTK
jgi:hypothetical protein